MRAHLRKLSCQAKYTKEEYENFKIEAKQRSDMNKKYDPLLKERAKYLRKENAKCISNRFSDFFVPASSLFTSTLNI